jgi:soluble lytic murein transglycosylase
MARQRDDFKRLGLWILLTVFIVGGTMVLFDLWRARRESSQDKVILAAAARYGVEPALVKAVVWRESWFDPQARGRAGEIGLMQIGELAAKEWAEAERIPFFTHSQLFDPAKNTMAGSWYLGKLLRRYTATDNPVPYALADYNAGRANVLKWLPGAATTNSAVFIEQIGFPSTKDYVQAVMAQREHYQPIFPPPQ